jgi:hypothetical protein
MLLLYIYSPMPRPLVSALRNERVIIVVAARAAHAADNNTANQITIKFSSFVQHCDSRLHNLLDCGSNNESHQKNGHYNPARARVKIRVRKYVREVKFLSRVSNLHCASTS